MTDVLWRRRSPSKRSRRMPHTRFDRNCEGKFGPHKSQEPCRHSKPVAIRTLTCVIRETHDTQRRDKQIPTGKVLKSPGASDLSIFAPFWLPRLRSDSPAPRRQLTTQMERKVEGRSLLGTFKTTCPKCCPNPEPEIWLHFTSISLCV